MVAVVVKTGVGTDAVEPVGVVWIEPRAVSVMLWGEGKLRSVVWAGVVVVWTGDVVAWTEVGVVWAGAVVMMLDGL